MRTKDSQFAALVQRAWSVVDEWARSVSHQPLPVGLETLAAAQNVCAIEFEPLFSDTGLEPEGDAFLICVNTEGRGVNQRAGTRWEIAPGALSELTPPLRFSVAHELAHLIILGLSGRKHDDAVFRRNWSALEQACNEMAGAILVPKPRLLQDIAGRFFDASHLWSLAKSFSVSADAFLQRLNLPDLREALKDCDGLLALARENGDLTEVTSQVIVGNLSSIRWNYLQGGGNMRNKKWTTNELQLPDELVAALNDKKRIEEKISVIWRSDTNMVLPCDMSAIRLYAKPLTVLIGIRVAGPPMHVG